MTDDYNRKVTVAYALTQAMEYWERRADDLKAKVFENPMTALTDDWSLLGPDVMEGAVRTLERAKLLRLWVSELHVLDMDVKLYGKLRSEAERVDEPPPR
jgi:hypothetical protein